MPSCPKYCLYLYVNEKNALPPALQTARDTDWIKNWGGLHCTLCSFAAKHDVQGPRFKHGADMVECIQMMHVAGTKAAAKHGVTTWRLSPKMIGKWSLDSSGKLIVGLSVTKDPVLDAMARVQRTYQLSQGDAKLDGLHLTLGPLRKFEKELNALLGDEEVKKVKEKRCAVPDAMVKELCKLKWDLLIVQDSNGVSPHTVTDKEERVALEFGSGSTSSRSKR
eukprot:GEMP01068638.1.p1 GENE.GEMP01068638.1~~GEMP01068638.1.p1  ORF type:complete len:222 (+),score=68.05 GEMP01068638.1:140-805(+)